MTESTAQETPQPPKETPQDIAASFKQSLDDVGRETGKVRDASATRPRAHTPPPQQPPQPAPAWTAEGVGRVFVGVNNICCAAYDVAELDDEESKNLAETSAYYLNERWPQGAAWEPEAKIIAALAGIWGPRIAAYRAAHGSDEEQADYGEIVVEPGEASENPKAN